MSPTNFGDLLSNVPIPNGACQFKRGAADSYTNYTSNNAAGTVFPDGSGGLMQISVTPTMPAYWLVTGDMIWWSPDAIWSRGDYGLRISPLDLDGRRGMQFICPVHSSVAWKRYSGSMMYRLAANTAYTASMTWEYSAGYNHQFSTSPLWHGITGMLIAEGVA